ncbi:hypothetical protein ACWHA6_36925 [Streptomyces anthocyanicus]|uniref:hypothetical protein n=1 Tax=Streptomyces TaxID=1883 RepID=UPI003652CACC
MFEETRQRPCGRPTKSGNPCRAQFSGPGFACKLHTTDHEKALLDAYQQGQRDGREQAKRWEQQASAARIAELERQIRALKDERDSKTRRFEVDGHQAVTVGGYGYQWKGPGRLEIGDRVLLPENYVSALRHGPGPFPGTVTELGTTYPGALSTIVSRAPATSTPAPRQPR